jgi:hypothetical protein
VQDLGAALPGEEEDAGVDRRDRVKVELERRDDAEVAAAAAAQPPEELRLRARVGADELAVTGHQLDRGDAVRGEAVLARVPADAAAERVAGDSHVGRGAVQRCEAELGGLRDDVRPLRARAHAGGVRRRVELDTLERVGSQDDRVGGLAERAGVVPRALGCDTQAVLPGDLDDRDHLGLVLGERDQGGAEVVGEVEGAACLVVAAVGGGDDGAVDLGAEGAGGTGGRGERDRGHGSSLARVRGRFEQAGRVRGAPQRCQPASCGSANHTGPCRNRHESVTSPPFE